MYHGEADPVQDLVAFEQVGVHDSNLQQNGPFSRKLSQFIFNIGKTRPLNVYFCSFLQTMTNIVQNLTINGKCIDGVLGA